MTAIVLIVNNKFILDSFENTMTKIIIITLYND